ncbi:hypothetical protein O7598_31075 [Micromonospora sp. WMMC241]|uniref:hypothetical protein n=1 Tax=Micromonospora sp. WMMC241 TaxID=3015159 RepID=UPI0022B6BD15|nr:hypothetical protein [Micromonospora sp. WMMC241]MCZ7440805.1 hypothetical protein [Micromonospora sp. WMMC241]MCZ7440868.1 hypothetical protein [Micromonospora sp. WMMC241]
MAQLYQDTTAVRVFFAPGEGLPASAWTDITRTGRQRLSALPFGCRLVVSFKDAQVDRRPFVEAWLKYRPDVTVDLITHHEPEQQTGGDPTPAQYRASWTLTRQQLADHPARAEGRLRLATCWTLQWIRKGGTWALWWPEHEADAVDLLLFDWYPFMAGEPNPWKPRVYEDPAAAMRVPIDIAAQIGRVWGIAEIDHPRILRANGFSVDLDPTGSLAAAWYRQAHSVARDAGCQVWAHFHADEGAAVGDLTKRPAEQAVLRDLIAQEAATVWSKGQNWRTVRSLDRLNEQIRAAHPRAVPPATDPASWGAIADGAHSSTSDHYPHFYSALGQTAVVCARDFPHAPGLGLDSHRIAEQLRLSRDRRIGYIISNARITGPNYGWEWSTYRGSDPHDTHIHVSTVHTAAADDPADWPIGEDEDMPTAKEIVDELLNRELPSPTLGTFTVADHLKGGRMAVRDIGKARAELAAAVGRDLVDEPAIIAGVLAGLSPEAIAAAIPKGLAKQVADELAARLAS